ncbi:MAG: histidinol-phosphatase [Spirochaetia bacterium]|jgi:histidinol-phosphatase (PHP family)|nr:histidinol-phosphatase [Spirochaetia bacterium]
MTYRFGSYNLHTHSYYCGHGVGEPIDYVREARKNGISLLGFSEHCPVKENRWASSRMAFGSLPDYLQDIKAAQQVEDIKVLAGFECDFYPAYRSYFQELKEQTDFLLFGVHYLDTPQQADFPIHCLPIGKKELAIYGQQYVRALESGLFAFGAHPDLFGIQYPRWDAEAIAVSKEILSCAASYDIPLEVNANGLLKEKVLDSKGFRYPYPLDPFWNLAKEQFPKVKIICNGDLHDPLNFSSFLENGRQWSKRMGIAFGSVIWDEKTKKLSVVPSA